MTADRGPALVLLRDLGADRVRHSGHTLLDHLLGTADLLAARGAPPEVELAGLMHSVYGTGSFGEAPLAGARSDDRTRVVAAIGEEAEHLVALYCRMDVPFLEDAVAGTSDLLDRDDWSALPASRRDLDDLVAIVRANRDEQSSRVGSGRPR